MAYAGDSKSSSERNEGSTPFTGTLDFKATPMYNMCMGIRYAMNSKPITVVGFIAAIHSIVYGVGFLFAVGGFQNTVLYRNISMVGHPQLFGAAILTAGLLVMLGLATRNQRLIAWFSSLQSMAWLFTFLAYVLNGQAFLGVGIALVWTAISSYVAYVHANMDTVLPAVIEDYRRNANKR